MNDRTAGSSSGNSKAIGNYLHKIQEVPVEVRQYALNKLTPVDDAGERIKDSNGNNVNANISTAKENGSYYGPIILTNEKYIVQAVGRERLSAVAHKREDIALQGASLALLENRGQLNNASVQIHYSGDKAKGYPWADKHKSIAEPAKEAAEHKPIATPAKEVAELKPVAEPVKEAMKAEDFMKKATDYAKENIKNTNQREAFLKHLGNVTEQAFNKQPEATKTKTMPAPEQAKQADNGIER